MAIQYISVCTSLVSGVCESSGYIEGYVLPPSATEQIDMLMQGGFSSQGFTLGFSAMIGTFAVGFGVGMIINIIRKLKR